MTTAPALLSIGTDGAAFSRRWCPSAPGPRHRATLAALVSIGTRATPTTLTTAFPALAVHRHQDRQRATSRRWCPSAPGPRP
ncbi:hypothetical protein, partial [Methylomagnum sp.]